MHNSDLYFIAMAGNDSLQQLGQERAPKRLGGLFGLIGQGVNFLTGGLLGPGR